MGNKSCYSNTRRRRRNTNSNLIGLTNTTEYVPHSNQYHIFPEKTSVDIQQKHIVDLFLASYYNTEILTNDLDCKQECIICFEPFCQRDIIARLECLCIYHKQCLDQWNQRKPCCPLHMDKIIITNRNKFISST